LAIILRDTDWSVDILVYYKLKFLDFSGSNKGRTGWAWEENGFRRQGGRETLEKSTMSGECNRKTIYTERGSMA